MSGVKGKSEAIFVPDKRKYLFYGDQNGLQQLKPIILQVIDENMPYECLLMGNGDIVSCLSDQKMGSFLYISADWEKLNKLKKLAYEIGFSDEEVQLIGWGDKKINVFCSRCHGMTKIKEFDRGHKLICMHCELCLLVSSHYSPAKDAYLGYVAKL